MNYREYIREDRIVNNRDNFKFCFKNWLVREHDDRIWKYQKLLRKEEYYDMKGHKLLSLLYRRRKNRLGERLGFTIHKNVFGSGLKIWHYGNVVVSSEARVGKNCILHGSNCIGNKGRGSGGACPVIGDNVDIGVGAVVLGDIRIANNVTIGAGAVVVHSCTEENVNLVGIPAKIVKHGVLLDVKKEK